jgi:hypothetical protein
MEITSEEFQQNVARYQDEALYSPITITKDGRAHTALLSATIYEVLVKGRIVRRVEDLDEGTIKAIAESEIPPEAIQLDHLLADWHPD